MYMCVVEREMQRHAWRESVPCKRPTRNPQSIIRNQVVINRVCSLITSLPIHNNIIINNNNKAKATTSFYPPPVLNNTS